MEQQITRVPRLMGTTMLSINYQKEPTDDNKNKLYKHIINQYALQGFRLLGQPISIPDLAMSIGLSEQEINQYISSVSKDLGAFNNPDQIQDTLTTIASLSTNWAIQDRGLIMQQVEILQRSQGQTYKPFISSELTKALKTGQDANKNFMELYKTFFTSSTTNVLNIYNNKSNEDESNFITPESALELLDQHTKALPSHIPYQLPNGDRNSFPELSKPIKAKVDHRMASVLSKEELSELSEKYRLGDFIKDQGPSSVSQRPPDPTYSPDSQGVTPPMGPESLKPKRRNSHQDFESRRGHDYEDVDAIE